MGKYPITKAVRHFTPEMVDLTKRRLWFTEENTDEETKDNVVDLSKIDWSKLDPNAIPDTVLKNTKAYKDVLTESVDRRKKIAELNKQLTALTAEENTQDQTDKGKEKPQDNLNTEEIPAWAKSLIDELKAQKSQTINAWRKQAAEATGITSTFVQENLQGESYEQVLAQATQIAKDLNIKPPTKQITPANPAGEDHVSKAKAAMERITKGDGAQVFSPEMQTALGGGVIRNN